MASIALPPKPSGPISAASFWTETAREYLDVYGAYVHGHRPAAHHRVWVERIQQLVAGHSSRRRLLLIAPPGFAKSTWLSLVFPPWYLGTHPDHSLLFFTSSDVNATQYGSTVKTTLEQNERHAATFPGPASRPNPERGWSSNGLYLQGTPATSKDPAYRSMGYGAAVVGARAHGIILDDPLTQDQAQSAVEQERAKRYHDMTVDSRLHPDGWELAIMTRWHESDLASHLLARESWDVCHMTALQEDGSSLWPERFSAEWLQSKRREIGVSLFSCLYQGDPSAMGGQIFRAASWFRPFPAGFDRATLRRVVQFWDLAYSGKDSADYTAAVTLGVDAQENLYVLNVWRGRIADVDGSGHMSVFRARADEQRPGLVGIEEAAYRQAATTDLINRLYRAGARVPIQAVRVTTDKVFRAQLPAGRAEAGMLFADTAAPWFPDFLAECLAFPLGAHDDQVDALSGAVQLALADVGNAPQKARFG